MDEQLEQNEARARTLVVVPVAGFAAVAGLVCLVVAVLLGVPVLGVLLVAMVVGGYVFTVSAFRRAAPTAALTATRSHPVTEDDEPRLHNLVEGLCVGIGLEPPRLRVVEDGPPNALAVARSVDDADLVVTRALIGELSRVELEAVLAHELARIRRGDAIVGALAGSVLRNPVYGPIARAVVGRGEPIETWSDLAAVEITRYPPALALALEKLAAWDAPPSSPVSHLWIHGARADGAFGTALSRVYEITPPVGQRIEVLQEL